MLRSTEGKEDEEDEEAAADNGNSEEEEAADDDGNSEVDGGASGSSEHAWVRTALKCRQSEGKRLEKSLLRCSDNSTYLKPFYVRN